MQRVTWLFRWRFTHQRWMAAACLVAVLLAGPSPAAAAQGAEPVTDPETGVVTYPEYDGIFASHVEGEVLYAQIPPVGGPHSGVWQDCGFYSEPIYNWHGVHSLEHGAIWITYDPGLPQADIEQLQELANQGHVLVTPYPGLTNPIVASAWGRQVRLESASDPRLQEFITEYRQNLETAPEPGALCSLGTTETMSPGEAPQVEPSVISGTPEEVASAEASTPQATPAETDADLRDAREDRD